MKHLEKKKSLKKALSEFLVCFSNKQKHSQREPTCFGFQNKIGTVQNKACQSTCKHILKQETYFL